MAVTNFGRLSGEQKTYWERELWKYMRDQAFWSQFMSTGSNTPVTHITKLTTTERGTRAMIQLVPDLHGRGVSNDNERVGNEEALETLLLPVEVGLIYNGVTNKGKLSDQKNVINFREVARDRLKYWLANAVDKLAFLTISGISYQYDLDGSDAGSGNPWTELSFASDVTPPSAGRHVYFDGSDLQPGNTSAITTGMTPKYGMLVDLRAYAKTSYMKPIQAGGREYYMWVCDPRSLAALKKDPDFLRAVSQAASRGKSNPIFNGVIETIDGILIREHNLVYNTTGAPDGSKWGAGGHVDGTRSLFMGAQGLAFADITAPEWTEEKRNMGNRAAIGVDKFVGFRKPVFDNPYTGNSNEDFGVIAVDLSIK